MVGLFNSHNFLVKRDELSVQLSKQAVIPYSRLELGKQIQRCSQMTRTVADAINSSFGDPSYIITDTFDGPVDCWVISSYQMREIIYIEHWKGTSPERLYIFMNAINNITTSFIKCLYNVKKDT